MESNSAENTFVPVDVSDQKVPFGLPEELWISVMASPCPFGSDIFLDVMINIIKNPNIISTYVFRAEVLFDSDSHPTFSDDPQDELFDRIIKHLKSEYRPIKISIPNYTWQRTFVIKQIPRNPQLDKPLVDTCHIFTSRSPTDREDTLILYIPHASTPEEIPYYHPRASALSIHHSSQPQTCNGTISIHYRLFPTASAPLPIHKETRLHRTAYNVLKIVHKHGVGRLAGYTKRVFHDRIIQQGRFQDTYTRLKIKYAKALIEGWVEQTDARKHVFEDLGIAAFLVEVWEEAYRRDGIVGKSEEGMGIASVPEFPGFVDIGCGNGVLVYILRQEGYRGWGFDARRRKTWDTFPLDVQENLKEMFLVPDILNQRGSTSSYSFTRDGNVPAGGEEEKGGVAFHNGTFPYGTFIISNHADELTPWTPLLAYLNHSPFIAIPCCSHNLAGARYRYNNRESLMTTNDNVQSNNSSSVAHLASAENGSEPKLGSLARPQKNTTKQPSAYASLTVYVTSLATEVGYEVEKEVLRIPSTRNIAIVGRRHQQDEGEGDDEKRRRETVKEILEREVGSVEDVGREWVERVRKIAKGKGAGH